MNTDNKDKGTLTLSSSKLTLGGGFKSSSQSVGHGRSAKSVTVVTKKRRSTTVNEDGTIKVETIKSGLGLASGRSKDVSGHSGDNAGGLTEEERTVRLQALLLASEEEKKREIEEKERLERRKQEDADNSSEEESEDNVVEVKEVAKESKVQIVQPVEDKRVNFAEKESDKGFSVKIKVKDDELDDKKKSHKASVKDNNKRRAKITITQAMRSEEEQERIRSLASVRRAREKARRLAMGDDNKPKEKVLRDVILPEIITVQELASRMSERAVDVTKALMKMGIMATANQTIDADTAELIVHEFGHNFKRVTEADVEDILKVEDGKDNEDAMVFRAPVVTFMGHVDHGKTSLLDAIRNAKVASGEAGGITQHIGAYQVTVDSGEKITFLDTPGHEAFTAMRKRGANATDIVVLVVAADDGIMAQTVEALSHAKAAGVPVIVAINKIDKPEANPTAVKSSLLEHELVPEEFGGETLVVEVSAKSGKNLDKLLETILLQSEVLDLKANPSRKAAGIVVESSVNKTKGVVTTFLVQKGTLRIGDIIVAGETYGRVRAMTDALGRSLSEASPSVPVEILGLEASPEAGSEFAVVDTERQSREIADYRAKFNRDLRASKSHKASLEDLFKQASNQGVKELPIIIKADVKGSAEAIVGSLEKFANDEVRVKVLHSAVGGISASDVTLADASGAIILGFNVRAEAAAKETALKENVDIRYYSIIYNLIDDVKAILGGMLKPAIREIYLGTAEIREIFSLSKKGAGSSKVAGCYVLDGNIKRGAGVRLIRDNVVIHEGKLKTLRRFKDDVKEVASNFECGMAFENYDDIKPGDKIEAFETVEEQRTL